MAFTARTAFRWLLVFIVAALAVFIAGCNRAGDAAAPGFRGIDLTGAPYGRNFRLTDADGRERTLADYKGKAVLMYFGFVAVPRRVPDRPDPRRQSQAAAGRRWRQAAGDLHHRRPGARHAGGDQGLHRRPSTRASSACMAIWRSAGARRPDDFKVYLPAGADRLELLHHGSHSALSYAFDPAGRLRLALQATNRAPKTMPWRRTCASCCWPGNRADDRSLPPRTQFAG
jgi:protein SCO1/2